MSRESAVSAIERGDLSELQHVLEKSEWDIGSEPLDSKGQTALHIACANGHLDIVQYLVNKKGCSVTVKDVYGHTPLMLSFINKHWKMANFLLQFAPDSSINNLVSCYNKSMVIDLAKEALAASCKEGYFELVKYLIKSGWHTVDPNEIIELARCFDNWLIVKYLLTHCQCTMPDDMSEVHIACIQGNMEKVKAALDSNGSSILGTADDFGTTPIHYATLEPNLLRMIVKYAGEMLLNIADGKGNTPLHHSIKYECIESITILVEAPGCDVNIANFKRETPLIAACKYSNSAIVQLLVANEKCDLNTSDNTGNTPLHVTISDESLDQLKNMQCLLQCDRSDPNVINKSSHTPLHIVCHRGDIPLLEALVADKRCDLNIQDGNGDTALHIGVENVEVVKCLLESGHSRCDIYNEEGLTPFHKAIENGVMASVEVMMKNGVNILQTTNDKFQNAPIHIACDCSRLDILKVLLGSTNCDPNQQNAVGDTALHIVCRMRTGRELNFLEVLASTPGINPLVNNEGIAPFDVIGIDGNTLFHIACAEGNTALVELLVKNGANILKPDRHRNAPIHVACKHSKLDILKFLLTCICRYCDPNQQNASGDTALHIVCRMKIDIVYQFLEALLPTPGINSKITNHEGLAPFEIVDSEGSTLLHNACFGGNILMVSILVKNGADILKPDRHGDAPIHIACKHSRLDTLKVLLSFKSCDPNLENAVGDTAIHIVSRMRDNSEQKKGKSKTMLQLLVKNGADILKPDIHGDAPIHIACKHSILDTLQVLLSFKSCDPNQQNAVGDTPIHIVSRTKENSKTVELLQLLVKNGADALKPDIIGDAPIHIACKHSRLDILKVLLGFKSSDPNKENADGDTPIHIVSRTKENSKTVELLELLVKNGADVLKPDRNGDAPIHIACKHSRLDTLKVLLGFKSTDPNKENADGDTAIHIVSRMRDNSEQKTGKSEIMFQRVVKYRADILKPDRQGDAPIHIACKYSRLFFLGFRSCDPNEENANEDTPIHIVSRMKENSKTVELLKVLVKNGADVLKPDRNGDAPIHIACKHSRLDTVKVLLGFKSCDPNQEDADGDTPIHIVSRMRDNNEQMKGKSESLELLELLVKNGANVMRPDRHGHTPIHVACKHSRLNILKFLLGCRNCDLNQQNASGDTALHIVCRMEIDIVYQFLKALLSTPGINPKITNHEGLAPFEIVDSKGSTLLHNACFEGNFETVELLVKNGADILKPDRNGNTPIHIACKHSRLDTLNVLLCFKSCDPNQQNAAGDTAIHIVSRMRDNSEHMRGKSKTMEFLQLLVKNGANVLKPDRHGNAPIHVACKHSKLDILKFLLDCTDCNPNQQNASGDTALHIVCRMEIDIVYQFLKALLPTPGINPKITNHEGLAPFEIVDSEGSTLLHNACFEGNFLLVELLAENGADISKPDRSGDAPIHIACKHSRLFTLNVLLDFKSCNPNQQNASGDTALHIVCRMEIDIVYQFLKALLPTPGINPKITNHEGLAPFEIVDSKGSTLLHNACFEGNFEIVELLVKNGADILKPNRHGDAPIHIACKHSRLDILRVIFSSTHCDPNQWNAEGDTALHIVCKMRTGKELQFLEVLTSTPGFNPALVNHEGIAPFEVVDSDGNTLLHIACAEGSTTMVELLVKNGADVLRPDRNGDAPIHIACRRFKLDILKSLLGFRSCDPNQKNADGDTAIHIVSRMRENSEQMKEKSKTVELLELLVKSGADILKPDKHGNVPIHIACKHSRLDTLRFILDCTNCDPNQWNAEGDTALHIVCKMRTCNVLKFIQVLTSTPGINPTLVNHEGIGPFEVVDSDGNTLLHIACAEGSTTMVELLVKNGADVLRPDRNGDAPIHIACKHFKLDILKSLLGFRSCNSNQKSSNGDTALHMVCRMTNQQNVSGDTVLHALCKIRVNSALQVLQTLISTPGIDPETVNHEGLTPIEVAGTNYSAIETIQKFLDQKRSLIQAYLKIFVVGNSGTGKSTLIKAVTTEASQLRKYAPLQKMKYVNPSDVSPHTAGIVPIPFNSKHFGNAVLYDFAGQHEYYSSHAAVMENLILPSPPLFLLLINISKSKEEIREELVYWWHFINNQSQKAAKPPHVILAGSHKDMVKSREREELEIVIRGWIEGIPITFKFVGYFSLDCRKLVSQGLSALLGQLNTTCQILRQIVDVNLHCHILNALLSTPELHDSIYCRAVDIKNRIEFDDAPLPNNFSQLIPLLASLNDQGHILLLQNHTDESKSWVILKPDVLLTEVNGSVFAPKGFKEQFEFAMSTGVVTLSKLNEKFTKYYDEVIVAYLTHLEFCFRIKDQHTLDMITKNEIHEPTTTEEYYFFPALVRVENPINVCQRHQSIGYECGWLYKCSKVMEQLTTRFLHVLILRLAFACDPPDDPTETESVVLLRSCSVWKHGIAWWTNDGIEVIVEVGLQCRWVAVMLRCPDDKMVECADLRSKVICTVLQAKTDFCQAIAMTEYLISPSSVKYPFEGRELTLYSMREVARATIEGKDYARDTEGNNPITIPELLPFEPYHNMGDLVPKFFSGDTAAVTPEELTRLAEKCHDKLAELKTAFKPDISSFQEECVKADCTEVKRCVALFHILQRRGRFKTWRDFQQEFSRFSVFCKQSPLEHIQKDKDRPLGDDTESRMASDSVRASEDVPQSLPSPAPNSPIHLPSQHIPHTSTDNASTEGAKETAAESENESYAHLTPVDTTHMSEDNLAVTGLTPATMIDLENEVIPTVCSL